MKSKRYQNGAVMIEAAYILPVMVAVILLLVEIVAYAMNSFSVSDVLTSVHSQIISEVSDVAGGDGAGVYATCVANKVVLPEGNNSSLATDVTTKMSLKGVVFTTPVKAVFTKTVVSGFDVYVINVTGTANTLVLPDVFADFGVALPISVDTIISVKDTCPS